MLLILRGHIRESFKNPQLYNLIKSIYIIFPDLKIAIHTWNIFANNISWREIVPDNTNVTDDTIFDYFNDLKHLITIIMIDDDTKIKLIGNVNGNIGNSAMKLLGWKNYWYGKFKIIDYLRDKVDRNEPVINCRFDVMNNSYSLSEDEIISFITNNKKCNKNVFFSERERLGIDNIYMGNINTLYKLSHLFFFELDDIIKKHNNIVHQEFLVFRINETM
jgi:hypothetical protein